MARLRKSLIQFWVHLKDKKTYERSAKDKDEALSVWIRRELSNAAKRQNNGTHEENHH